MLTQPTGAAAAVAAAAAAAAELLLVLLLLLLPPLWLLPASQLQLQRTREPLEALLVDQRPREVLEPAVLVNQREQVLAALQR